MRGITRPPASAPSPRLRHLSRNGFIDERLMVPTSSPGIHSGVDQRGLDVFVSKKIFDSRKVAGVCVEHNLCVEMAELMRGEFDPGPLLRVRADQVGNCALRFGSPVGKDEQALRTMANVLGCD